MFRKVSVALALALLAAPFAIAQDATAPTPPIASAFEPTAPLPDLRGTADAPAPAVDVVAAPSKPDTIVGLGSTLTEIISTVGLVLAGLVTWLSSFLRARNLTVIASALHGTEEQDGILDRALAAGMQWCNAKASDLGNVDVKNAVLANGIIYMQTFANKELSKFRANNSQAILKLLLPHLPEVPADAVAVPRIIGESAAKATDSSAPTATAPAAMSSDFVAQLQDMLKELVNDALDSRLPKAA